MRNPIKLGIGVLAGAALSLAAGAPALAGATVQRYQVTNYAITATVTGTNFGHSYTATTNPCTSTPSVFSGSGFGTGSNAGISETISGSLVGTSLTYTATYTTGYSYTVTATVTGTTFVGTFTSSSGQSGLAISGTINVTSTQYMNHGTYVASQGGGSTAAHSCIGMPITG